MKSRYILFASIAVVSLACCTKNEPAVPGGNQEEPDVPALAGQTSLTAIINTEGESDETKAAVDDNGTVTWSAGDALSVYTDSGFTTFTLDGAGGSGTGTFKAEGEVTPQTVAVYPAGTHSLSGNDLTVNLPASYTLASTDDANTNVPMIATGDFTTGKLSFKQIGGLFRFTHYTVPPEARKFVFKSEGYKINGDFVIDITAAEPKLEAGTTGSAAESEVTVNFPAPADTVEMNFFIPIPTGAYNNLTISLLNGSDKVIWTTTTGSTSGTSTIDIARKSFKKMPAVGGIKTAEELCNLGALIRAGKSFDRYKDCAGWVTLRNDIDMSGVTDWIPIGGGSTGESHPFTGQFDGRDHTIDYLTKTYSGADQYRCGVFGVLASGAKLKNLTLGKNSSFTYTRTSSYVRLGGIVCWTRFADIELSNLTNKASVTATMAGASEGVWIGGVCGQLRSGTNSGLKNEGPITFNGTAAHTVKRSANLPYEVGGVIGYMDSGTPAVRNCSNSGTVTVNSIKSTITAGVIGRATVAATYANLKNTGTVTASVDTTTAYVAGVIGHMKGATCTNLHCTSTSQVRFTNSKKNSVGGVIGYIEGASTLSGIINNGIVYASSNQRMGGLISTFGTSINLSDSAFGGELQCVSGQGADVGLVIGTDGYTADANTLSNIKISGSFGPSGSQYTIASAADYEAHVQTVYSTTWATDKTKMRLVNPTNSDNTVKEAVYAKFLAACSYGTMSTE